MSQGRDIAMDERRGEGCSQQERLYAAVRLVCGQAGEAPDAFIEWLCSGGFAEMAVSHFTRPSAEAAVKDASQEKGTGS